MKYWGSKKIYDLRFKDELNLNFKPTLFIFFIIITLFFATHQVLAATYYIATTGSDSNSGISTSSPWATFAYAFSKMSGGDTLYVMDGIYNQSITNVPSGLQNNYTKIYALNYHKVTIDGQGNLVALQLVNKSYIEIAGLIVKNGSADTVYIEYSDHINLKSSGVLQEIPDNFNQFKYNYPIVVARSSYILLEDIWVAGRGRYAILIYDSHDNIVRRAVTRFDVGSYPGQPVAGISLYGATNNIVENCVIVDQNTTNQDQSGIALYGNPDQTQKTVNNKIYGCIVLNNPGVGFLHQVGDASVGDNIWKDNISWDNLYGIDIQQSNGGTYDHLTLSKSAYDGSYVGDRAGGIHNFTNSIFYRNGGWGVNNHGMVTPTLTRCGSFGNSSGDYNGVSGSDSRYDDPFFKYITRIENNSSYHNAGVNGDIGANVIYRYKDGILSNQLLWPWPYENWIKEDMCNPAFLAEVGRTGANTPKWCTTSKTLTQYIWEYLGNAIPPEIYGGGSTPDTTPPSAPSNLQVQ